MNYRNLLGIPYKENGRDYKGIDCYGLAIEVQKMNGKEMNDCLNGEGFKINCEKIENLEELCIIEFNVLGQPLHIGTYIGDGLVIHTTVRTGVIIEPLYRLERRIRGLYKVKN